MRGGEVDVLDPHEGGGGGYDMLRRHLGRRVSSAVTTGQEKGLASEALRRIVLRV